MLQRKLHKDLSQDDKLDNVKRYVHWPIVQCSHTHQPHCFIISLHIFMLLLGGTSVSCFPSKRILKLSVSFFVALCGSSIQLIEEFLRREMMHKQELDDLRYEKIKDERNYLIQQVRASYTLSWLERHLQMHAVQHLIFEWHLPKYWAKDILDDHADRRPCEVSFTHSRWRLFSFPSVLPFVDCSASRRRSSR